MKKVCAFLLVPVFLFAGLLTAGALVSGCSSGGGDNSESNPGENSAGGDSGEGTPGSGQRATGSVEGIAFTSLCGVSRLERLVNPAPDAEFVTVDVISSDKIAITRSSDSGVGGAQLIKLHGVTANGVNDFKVRNGAAVLADVLAEGAAFVEVGEGCDYIENGAAVGVLGQIFSLDGRSMSELMLQEGAVVPVADTCGGDELAACYSGIGAIPRPPTDIELDAVTVNFRSQCGAVKDGVVLNPVTLAEDVAVEVVDVDEVIVTRLRGLEAGNKQAVKLQGLSTQGVVAFRQALGRSLLSSETAAGAYLAVADQGCPAALSGGGNGVYGQLYSRAGVSLNEELLSKGAAVAAADTCGGNLLTACYGVIQAAVPPPGDEEASDLVIDDFLWKPVSDSTGKLAVLANPAMIRIVVTGNITETLSDGGSGNGRGINARGQHPGCDFGNDVKVEFFDQQGRRIFLADGRDSVIVPRGCERYEFKL